MKLNENNAKYAIVKTAFHGGGILSYHISQIAAEKAARKYRGACECGCCAVIPIEKLAQIPEYTGNEHSPYSIRK